MASRAGSSIAASLIKRSRTTLSGRRATRVGILASLMAFMLWVRVRNFGRLVASDGTVMFTSPDAWYHRRATTYSIENYPNTLPFDPYTAFGVGNQAGQFGTIYDLFLATVALVAGLGDPSPATIDAVLLFTPPILGTLTLVPVYLTARHLSNQTGGLVAALTFALAPGLFLSRTVAGAADHHAAETLLLATSIYLVLRAVALTGADLPVGPFSIRRLDHLEWRHLSRPLRWWSAAAVATVMYLLTWPPGIYFVGIITAGLIATAVAGVFLRQDTRLTTLLAGLYLGLTATLLSPSLSTASLSTTSVSVLHLGVLLGGAIGVPVVGVLCHRWIRAIGVTTGSKLAFVFLSGCLFIIAFNAGRLIAPEIVNRLLQQGQYVIWFLGDGSDPAIAEAATLENPLHMWFITYGFGFLAALVGGAILVLRSAISKNDYRENALLLVIVSGVTVAAISQIRFDYYFAIVVALLAGYGADRLISEFRQRWGASSVRERKLRLRLVSGFLVSIILLPSLLAGMPVAAADAYTSAPSETPWEDTFTWIRHSTPEVGSYGTGDEPRLDYYGRYEPTSDFDYREGEYGILTRWAVGHQLTVESHRIPVSNPHQKQAGIAADILLADSEEVALERADRLVGDGAGVQYVVLDNSLGTASSPVFANPVHYAKQADVGYKDIVTTVSAPDSDEELELQTSRSYQSLRTRLYQFHGSATPASTQTIDTNALSGQTDADATFVTHDSPEAARRASQSPGVFHGGSYGESPTDLEAVQHFRLVYATESSISVASPALEDNTTDSSGETAAIKVFERVPGAPVHIAAEPGQVITARVELSIPTRDETFTYQQYATADKTGTAKLVLPYATQSSESTTLATGYTNSSVVATGPYTVTLQDGPDQPVLESSTFTVSERAVVTETDPTAIEMGGATETSPAIETSPCMARSATCLCPPW